MKTIFVSKRQLFLLTTCIVVVMLVLLSAMKETYTTDDTGTTLEHEMSETTIHTVPSKVLENSTQPRTTPSSIDAPGEMGQPVIINQSSLSDVEKNRYTNGWEKYKYNAYASDMISLHRSLPDYRDTNFKCRDINYGSDLPATSVIITFYNEVLSALLRTVWSVLDRSPPNLIVEIILVDDYSDIEELKAPLEDFVSGQNKVRLVRAGRREGLIRARLLGTSEAQGPVLTFLDSHCEVTQGWLEPLLSRIAENDNTVVMPVIDTIADDTLKYIVVLLATGTFDWTLNFAWHDIGEDGLMPEAKPIKSPTMAGGLFSIRKNYFQKLGTYDPELELWGGENMELSFKIWMCGGSLEVLPCSRVGHIFKMIYPVRPEGSNKYNRNVNRVAEVWLDEYKLYFLKGNGYTKFDAKVYGNVSERVRLRKELGCKSFDWYMKTVRPYVFRPHEESLFIGEIRSGNINDNRCFSANNFIPLMTTSVCSGSPQQLWSLTKEGVLRLITPVCVVKSPSVAWSNCAANSASKRCRPFTCTVWRYSQETHSLVDVATEQCLTDVTVMDDQNQIDIRPCDGSTGQQWFWKETLPALGTT